MLKRILKKLLRYTIRIIIGILAFVVLYAASAYILSNITVNSNVTASNDVNIYIHSNGVHTDINSTH